METRVVSRDELTHRFTYHAPGAKARGAHDEVCREFLAMALYVNEALPEGGEKWLCITSLEQASFWAHAAIARSPAGEE